MEPTSVRELVMVICLTEREDRKWSGWVYVDTLDT